MINMVVLEGMVAQKPESLIVGNGYPVTKMKVGVKVGSKKKGLVWIPVVAWGEQAYAVDKMNLDAKDTVFILGKLAKRSWDAGKGSNMKLTEVYVVANSVVLIAKGEVTEAEQCQDQEDI